MVWEHSSFQQSRDEQRTRVKALFASIDMDGSVKRWAERWGLLPEVVRRVSVTLPDGTIFNFDAYLRGQADGTEWLREKLERQVGMHSFITTWLAHHKPYK